MATTDTQQTAQFAAEAAVSAAEAKQYLIEAQQGYQDISAITQDAINAATAAEASKVAAETAEQNSSVSAVASSESATAAAGSAAQAEEYKNDASEYALNKFTFYKTPSDPDGTIAGIAATTNGQSFRVAEGPEATAAFKTYENQDGVAVLQASQPGTAAVTGTIREFPTLTAAQADVGAGNILNGSYCWVRNSGNSTISDEYLNTSGTLVATGRQILTQSAFSYSRLSNMFDDGGFRSGIPPKMKNASSTYVTGKLVSITDSYLMGIGCKYGARLPDGDTYTSVLASPVKIPEPLYGKYVLMSALVYAADGNFGSDSTCSYLADAGLNNITSPTVPYVNYRRDVSSTVRCYATLAFVPADGSARYLHIGKGGLGAPSDTRLITGLCYVFSESVMNLDSIKWDAPYPASDFAINHRELDKKFNYHGNIIPFGDMDGGAFNPLIRSGSSVVALTTQQTLIERGYKNALQARTGGTEFIRSTGNADLRGKTVCGYFLIYAENQSDVDNLDYANIFQSNDGALAQITYSNDIGKKKVGDYLWLLWAKGTVNAYTNPVTELCLGWATAPVTANRFATGFYLSVGATDYDIQPLLWRLTERNVAKRVVNELDTLNQVRFTNQDVLQFNFERNLLTYGDMDGGSLNPPVRGGSAVVSLTTQQALLDRGYTRAIRWRTDGSATEFVGYTSTTDLRGKYVGAYFLIYAENPADVAGIARAQIFQVNGASLVEITYTTERGIKTVGPNLYLVWQAGQVSTYTSPVYTLWVGSGVAPATSERYATAFFLMAADTAITMDPVLRRLTERNMAKLVNEQYTSASAEFISEKITVKNSSKIVILGDSYTESMHALKDKSYAAMVSMLTDWRIEPYGVSGNDCVMMNQRIISNSPTFGWGIRDMGASHVVIISQTNDAAKRSISYRYWQEDMQRVIQSVRALGAKPIFSTEHPQIDNWAYAQTRQVAEKFGAEFWDITTEARNFEFNSDGRLWVGSHPGTRTNTQLWSGMLKGVNGMPRPRSGIKIFRVRPGYTVGTVADLVYDDVTDRAQRFKEITLGHTAIPTADQSYFDNLSVYNAINTTRTRYNSEYGQLAQGTALAFTNYALVEAILPSSADGVQSVRLVTAGSAVTVYALNRLTQPAFTTAIYKAFTGVTATPAVGDVYSDGTTSFTVVGQYQDKLICNPNAATASSGTLTKVSGSGPSSITYTGAEQGFDPAYYTHYADKKGNWEAVTGAITSPNIVKYMQGDKISFLIAASGSFSLSDIHVEYTGRDSKSLDNWQPVERRARGAELLAQGKFGDDEISGWTRIGSVPRYVPSGGNPPAGCTKVVVVDDTNYITQDFTAPTEADAVELEIKVWCRRWVSLFDSSSSFSTSTITPDSYDLSKIRVLIGQQATGKEVVATEFSSSAALGWREIKFRYWHTGNNASPTKNLRLTVMGEAGKQTEVAFVSIREV
ncbi:TPA: SGNH/GDSL hydrolase family protein [Klebsiella quasipneumoniae]